MNEEETKKPNPTPEETVTITLTKGEVFHLNLSVVARLAAAQMKFVNAYCKEEQEQAQGLIEYLTSLSAKLSGALRDGQE